MKVYISIHQLIRQIRVRVERRRRRRVASCSHPYHTLELLTGTCWGTIRASTMVLLALQHQVPPTGYHRVPITRIDVIDMPIHAINDDRQQGHVHSWLFAICALKFIARLKIITQMFVFCSRAAGSYYFRRQLEDKYSYLVIEIMWIAMQTVDRYNCYAPRLLLMTVYNPTRGGKTNQNGTI